MLGSSASSTGLIMATGNVGHHLHNRLDEVNTYFRYMHTHTVVQTCRHTCKDVHMHASMRANKCRG